MSHPYTRLLQVSAESGQDNYFEIPFLHRGTINNLRVVQVTGDIDGFNLDLYNSKKPMEEAVANAGGSSSSRSAVATLDDRVYQIIPTQSTEYDLIEVGDGSQEWTFRNVDGTYTNPVRKLYLRLNPEGAGVKVFELSLTGVEPHL